MNIFELNTLGNFLINEKSKEFYKMLIGGVIFYLLLFFAYKYTVPDKVYFAFMAIFLSILYVLLFVFIPITLKIRINKVVRKIQCDSNKVFFITNKENIFDKNEIRFIEVKNRFSGFSREKKDGILIKTKGGKEFWIIEDFYNYYEKLKALLLNSAVHTPLAQDF